MASCMGDNNDQNVSKDVYLYIYDMSRGMASTLSPFLLGKQIPAIWHTGIVAYDKEYYFGSAGIECIEKANTILGDPDRILPLGETEIPYNIFYEYLVSLSETSYKPQDYDLFEHNCNNFTQEIATFLTGKSIPQEILDLPKEVSNTPLGMTIKTLMGNSRVGNGLFSFTPNTPMPISSQNSISHTSSSGGSEANNLRGPSVASMFEDLNQRVPLTQSHVLDMIHQYLDSQVSALDIKSEHMNALDQLLNSADEAKIKVTLSIISKAAVKKDFYHVLNLDIQAPKLMRGLKKVFDEGSQETKKAVLELLIKLADAGLNWLMDKSKTAWVEEGKSWTHRSATVAMMVAGLLGEIHLREVSLKLTHTVATKMEELEEEATEMTTAILQCLQNSTPSEKDAFLALESIMALMNACPSEVPGLVQVLGPDLSPLSQLSSRLSDLVSQLLQTSSFYLN